ncbi:MAG: type II secretion system F family protein [Candidatus Norongarragalinales archaeon]
MRLWFLSSLADEYRKEKRQKEIDDLLPQALFQIASFPSNSPIEKMLEAIAQSDCGALSEEFALALERIRTGYSVRQALDEMKKRNSSMLLQRACDLVLKFYSSGASNSGKMFKEVAEDVYSLQEIVRETSSALALQKYTLLIGGSVLVPMVLALLFNISSSLQEGFTVELLDLKPDLRMRETVLLATQAYLIVFAFVSSVFVARLEEKTKKALLYFSVMAPLSLFLFNLVRGAILL